MYQDISNLKYDLASNFGHNIIWWGFTSQLSMLLIKKKPNIKYHLFVEL
jgi:hypothetical protein